MMFSCTLSGSTLVYQSSENHDLVVRRTAESFGDLCDPGVVSRMWTLESERDYLSGLKVPSVSHALKPVRRCALVTNLPGAECSPI